jgi:3-methyladenine DNA glycosylase AlkC
MKSKLKIKKKKIRIPLPKQLAKVKESNKIYKRAKVKKILNDL